MLVRDHKRKSLFIIGIVTIY